MKKKEKNDVFPFEELAIEEELLASFGTHVEGNKVRASVFGKPYLDWNKYRAKVIPYNKRKNYPRKNDMIIGHVDKVSKNSVRVSVFYLNNKPIFPYFSAIMHISDSSRDYVKDLDDVYAGGDIIRAKIIDAKTYPVQLEAKGSNTGVIHTTCELCGESVKKIKRNTLECIECGHKQNRYTAIDFGSVSLISDY